MWPKFESLDHFRSPAITFLFKLRITNLLALLAICDVLAIWYAYERTMSKGASVQLVFGFGKFSSSRPSVFMIYDFRICDFANCSYDSIC